MVISFTFICFLQVLFVGWSHSDLLVISWWSHGDLMVNTCWSHGERMMISWWSHGDLMVISWWSHVDLIVISWWSYCDLMVILLRSHGEHMVISFTFICFSQVFLGGRRQIPHDHPRRSNGRWRIVQMREPDDGHTHSRFKTTVHIHRWELSWSGFTRYSWVANEVECLVLSSSIISIG